MQGIAGCRARITDLSRDKRNHIPALVTPESRNQTPLQIDMTDQCLGQFQSTALPLGRNITAPATIKMPATLAIVIRLFTRAPAFTPK